MVVEYRVISEDQHDERFVVDGVDMMADLTYVKIGEKVQIALKSDVRPGSRKSPATRLIAPYVEKVIISPEDCTCACDRVECSHENHGATICPNCLRSWGWDWLIRRFPFNAEHGQLITYVNWGCRCPLCRLASRKYKMERGETRRDGKPYTSHFGYEMAEE